MNQLTIYSLNIECQLCISFLLSGVDTMEKTAAKMPSKVDFKAWWWNLTSGKRKRYSWERARGRVFWICTYRTQDFLLVHTAGSELPIEEHRLGIFTGNSCSTQESEGFFWFTFLYNHSLIKNSFYLLTIQRLGLPDLALLSFHFWSRICLAVIIPTVRITTSFVWWFSFHCVHNDCWASKF